jgi:hypothetical protein
MQQLENIAATNERVLIATGRYIGEGFDDARLSTLFLVHDYIDEAVPVLKRMSERRMRRYRNLGYAIDCSTIA